MVNSKTYEILYSLVLSFIFPFIIYLLIYRFAFPWCRAKLQIKIGKIFLITQRKNVVVHFCSQNQLALTLNAGKITIVPVPPHASLQQRNLLSKNCRDFFLLKTTFRRSVSSVQWNHGKMSAFVSI